VGYFTAVVQPSARAAGAEEALLSDGVSDPATVLPGAEPFDFAGGAGENGRTGVLLVHGFTGTPMSMRPWGEHLAAAGFAVRCPLLPGHGTRWQDCNASTHAQWTTAVEEAFDELAADCDRVFVAGLSMGGTVAIRLAELRPDVAGLVVVNPSLLTRRLDARLLPVLARVTGSWAPIGSDIKKPGIVEQAYDKMPLRGMMALRRLWRTTRAELHRVTAPVLAFTSVEDHVVEPESTDVLLDGVSSEDVTQVKLEDSYHVATLDNDAPMMFARTVEWVRAHARAGDPSPPVEQA
jgi:esterase/lipase